MKIRRTHSSIELLVTGSECTFHSSCAWPKGLCNKGVPLVTDAERRKETIMAKPTIQVGSTGKAVQDAQNALIDRGYQVGASGADGIFGIHTLKSVLNYQDDRSTGNYAAHSWPLVTDGIVGPQTWGRLAPDTVKKGSKGAGVKLVQSSLKDTGYPPWDPGMVDGDFGPQTELAVSTFQTDVGITKDGIVGPQTWLALWS
jgi:peptidoglycan hydrolase-like protein with peptidoglycan-binding domain